MEGKIIIIIWWFPTPSNTASDTSDCMALRQVSVMLTCPWFIHVYDAMCFV